MSLSGLSQRETCTMGDQNRDRRVQGELSYTEGVLCWDSGVILDMEMDDMRFRERIPSISSELLEPCSTSMKWDFTNEMYHPKSP